MPRHEAADVARRPFSLLALLALALATLAATAAVSAAAPAVKVTQQGVAGRDFTFETLPDTLSVATTAGGQDVSLTRTAVFRISQDSPVYGGTVPDPRSIEVLAGGNLLFTDRAPLVAEVTRAGEKAWTYTTADDPDLQRPFSAQRFTRDGQELTLIADRWACRVFAVDQQKNVVWQYGVTNESGTTTDHLADPFYARYSDADGGTVLIADCNGGNRVIEVKYDAYRAGAPDNGFDEQSILWSYGTAGVEGSGLGLLDKPHSAQRLASGNVLITDADGARVFEVDRVTKDIVWQFGVTAEPGDGADHLTDPNYAARLSDGDTLIVDTGNGRVIRVTATGDIDTAYDVRTEGRPSSGTGEPDPRAAVYTADNLLAVAESQFQQIVLLGYQSPAQAISTPLDCGLHGVKKAFRKLTWKGDTGQSGTKVAVDYRLDGGKWTACSGIGASRSYDFPGGKAGETIAYRVTLSTANYGHTPVLDSISIQWMKAKTGPGKPGGGSNKPGGSGNSGQSGSYTYPSTAEGGTGTSGTGTGSGSSGSGTGAGSSGTGSGSSGAGAGSSSTASSVEVPIQSTGSGSAQSVQGYQVQGQEGVSGVPLRAEQGAQAPEPGRPAPAVPVLALIAVGLIVAAAFFVPWPFVAAHLRRFTGFDHTRPARFLPFRPLGK